MSIEATKDVEKYWDLKTYQAVQVTLAVGSADKLARDVVVVMDLAARSLALY